LDATSATAENPNVEIASEPAQTTPSAPNDSTASQFADELADAAVSDTPSEAANVAAQDTSVDTRYEIPTGGQDDPSDPSDLGAETIAATLETPPPTQPANTRSAAWLMGSKLSLAALANDRGVAADEVPVWFQEARSAAETLQISLAELPETPSEIGGGPASREVLGYLIEQGREIGPKLATNYGPDHAALFEVAVKSNFLLVLYKPGSTAVDPIATAIENSAPRAGLAPEVYKPMLDALANRSPAVEVRAAVRRLHADVERFLASAVEP
jgi:hypothetical protein